MRWFDIAYVAVRRVYKGYSEDAYAWTDLCEFPREYVLQAFYADGGFMQNTAGQMMAQSGKFPGMHKQNPHACLPPFKIPRSQYLAIGVSRALTEFRRKGLI